MGCVIGLPTQSGNKNQVILGKSGQVIGSPTQPGERNQVILAIWRFQVANQVGKLDHPLNWVRGIRSGNWTAPMTNARCNAELIAKAKELGLL